jgi:hypothetical protein
MLSGKPTNTNLYSLWFDPTGLESTIYHTGGEHANHYTTDVVDKEEGQTAQWPKDEGQTTQWPKEKGPTKIYKTLHRNLM